MLFVPPKCASGGKNSLFLVLVIFYFVGGCVQNDRGSLLDRSFFFGLILNFLEHGTWLEGFPVKKLKFWLTKTQSCLDGWWKLTKQQDDRISVPMLYITFMYYIVYWSMSYISLCSDNWLPGRKSDTEINRQNPPKRPNYFCEGIT